MLHTLRPTPGSRLRRTRVARGNSAGGGTTAGRGTKGQQSRTGKGKRFGFEGGQTPLIRRQPKLGGFSRPRRVEHQILPLARIEAVLSSGTYGPAELLAAKLVRGKSPIKLLGNAPLQKKFGLTVHAASKGAKAAVTKAGGTVTITRISE